MATTVLLYLVQYAGKSQYHTVGAAKPHVYVLVLVDYAHVYGGIPYQI